LLLLEEYRELSWPKEGENGYWVLLLLEDWGKEYWELR
jgi:hypothetical protein